MARGLRGQVYKILEKRPDILGLPYIEAIASVQANLPAHTYGNPKTIGRYIYMYKDTLRPGQESISEQKVKIRPPTLDEIVEVIINGLAALEENRKLRAELESYKEAARKQKDWNQRYSQAIQQGDINGPINKG